MRALLAAALAAFVLAAGCLDTADEALEPEGCPSAPATVARDIAIPAMTGGGRVGDTDRLSVPVPLGDDLPGFPWSCVRAVEVLLAWTNTASAGADLYVGVELPSGLSVTGTDHQQFAVDGAHQESVLAAVGWGPHDAAQLEQDLTVVILSDWASLSSSTLPATLTISLLV